MVVNNPPPPKTTRQKVDRRPVSTFWTKPRSEMTFAERICNLATCPPTMHELKSEDIDRGPVPRQSVLRENVFIITRAIVPLVIHAAAYWLYPGKFTITHTKAILILISNWIRSYMV